MPISAITPATTPAAISASHSLVLTASAISFSANAPIANARPAPTTIDQLGTPRARSR